MLRLQVRLVLIIVAGVRDGLITHLAHMDRLSLDNGAMIIAKKGRIIFASALFANAEEAAKNGNLQYLMKACEKYGIAPEIYASHQLAVDSRTSKISTAFKTPKVEVDEYTEALAHKE